MDAAHSNSDPDRSALDHISRESKNFYSAGTTFTSLSCAGVVGISWDVLSSVWPYLSASWFGLILSFFVVLAYALVIPEPRGYPNPGRMRLTIAELIFGSFNSFMVFAVVMGFKCMNPPG